MNQDLIVQIGCALLALVFVSLAIKLCWRRGWLLKWMRGNLGLLCVCFAVLLVSLAIDLRAYKPWANEETVAQLSFVQFKPQIYIARLSAPGAQDLSFELHGDRWQIDARSIAWNGLASQLGLQTVYRFDSLTGRHLDLRNERHESRYVHALGSSRYSFDTWQVLHNIQKFLPFMRPQYASGSYAPMAHEARYDIVLSGNELRAVASNAEATVATNDWQ